MNFLAHYYFDKTESVYYNVGLVLPDLNRNFCKGNLQLNKPFEKQILNDIQQGCIKHIAKDKIFHQSIFFKETQKQVSQLIDHQSRWPRKWFLNHILVEIMLDRALMDKFPLLCHQFYNDLEQAETIHLEEFLKHSGIEDYQEFGHKYVKFNEYKFIFNYLHNEKLIIALSKIYQKVGIKYEWSAADENILNRNFIEILQIVDNKMPELINEIEN